MQQLQGICNTDVFHTGFILKHIIISRYFRMQTGFYLVCSTLQSNTHQLIRPLVNVDVYKSDSGRCCIFMWSALKASPLQSTCCFLHVPSTDLTVDGWVEPICWELQQLAGLICWRSFAGDHYGWGVVFVLEESGYEEAPFFVHWQRKWRSKEFIWIRKNSAVRSVWIY